MDVMKSVETHVESNLRTELGGDLPPQPVWEVLITALIPILVEVLSNCWNSSGRQTVENRLRRPDFFTRVAARQSVNRLESETGQRFRARQKRKMIDGVLKACSTASDEQISAMLGELEQDHDWIATPPKPVTPPY